MRWHRCDGVCVCACASKCWDTLSKSGFGVVKEGLLVYMTLFVISLCCVIPPLICGSKSAL